MVVDQQRRSGEVLESFLGRVGTELKRAERYRVFLALGVLDFGSIQEMLTGVDSSEIIDKLQRLISGRVRACDTVSLIDNQCLCLLFPETSRQGAEMAIKRIKDEIRAELAPYLHNEHKPTISVELASYPDAAGARTIKQFVEELQQHSQN